MIKFKLRLNKLNFVNKYDPNLKNDERKNETLRKIDSKFNYFH